MFKKWSFEWNFKFVTVALPPNAQHHFSREEFDYNIPVADRHFKTFHQTWQGGQIRPLKKGGKSNVREMAPARERHIRNRPNFRSKYNDRPTAQ
jgi:hypothetical protein